ncbi:MAG: ROK family protein [Deltaproteobacteria bacterium]|nr:ROK family protein [Deltaproteobacteria bacterium]
MKRLVVGIDLGGTMIKAALVDREGRIVGRREGPTGPDLGPKAVIGRIASVAEDLAREAKEAHGAQVVALGLGCPGGIRVDLATVSQSPNFREWNEVDVRSPLQARLRVPVAVDNDANAAAQGEHWQGAGRGCDSLVLVTLGTGVGGGVVLGGRVWRGAWGMAGEIGHVNVEPEGPLCGCGSRGCLETYASATAMARAAREGLARGEGERLRELAGGDPTKVDARLVHEAAKDGDALCLAVLAEAGRRLGIALASVLNLLGPSVFVIGGGAGRAFDLIAPSALAEIRARAFREPASHVRLVPTALGNDAGAVGAAKLAWDVAEC